MLVGIGLFYLWRQQRQLHLDLSARRAVHQLPETPDDVLALSHLGPHMYQGTLRSGTLWRGDAQLSRSLPQGAARLATLQTREHVAQAKAKAKGKAKEPGPKEVQRAKGGSKGPAKGQHKFKLWFETTYSIQGSGKMYCS